jgi:PAS domain S-box-containing protein
MIMENLDPTIARYSISPLFFLLLIGGIIGIITFLFLIRYRNNPGVKFWLIWQIAASIWAFTYAFEYAATDIETKILWSKFSYFGIVFCPVSFMFFSLAFSSQYKFLQKKFIVLVFAFASLFIWFPFTNDLHHLHWKSYAIDPETNATDYVYGPLFWIMTIFAYFALISGIINIFRLYFRLSNFYRKQITLLFIASLLPPIGNLIYIFHVNPISGFDWTPFTFLLTGILIAINISRFKMFDLVPFARNKLIDIIPDAILIVDNSHLIADLNPAMRKLIDSTDIELIGTSAEKIFPHRETLIAEIKKYDDFQSEISREIEGKTHFFDLQVTSLFDHQKQQTGRLVILKDITHRIDAEEKIKETNVRLMEEIQEKEKLIVDLEAFSHTVAHDLKNMLGAIVIASNLIKSDIDEMSKEDLLEFNDMINQSATKTIHITNELLTLASVRQQEVKLTDINMLRIIKESMKRLTDMIREKNAQITIPEFWPEVLGYEGWLEEVWLNYISNAIKYGGTPPVIELGSEILAGQKVKFWIKDNGKGLSKEDIALLFNKFTRLDTLKAEGTGLGLSIVKRIIEKLNGEVGIESSNIPGEGSTFYFTLPMV